MHGSTSYPVALLVALTLGTTVGYLTEETDNPAPDRFLLKIDDVEDIKDMIACYRHLPPDTKWLIREMIEKLER